MDISYTREKRSSSITFSSHDEQPIDVHVAYTEDVSTKTAWVIAVLCQMINISCAMAWLTAASAPTVCAEWLGNISLTQVNWLSNASCIITVLSSLAPAWMYDHMGTKKSIIFAAVVNTVGCWVRCVAILLPSQHRYTLYMIGQCITAVGGPFIFNIATKFVSIWFASKHRGFATNLVALNIGAIVSPLLLPAIAPTANDVPKMLIVVACISTASTIPSFFFPGKPKVPPSPTSDMERMPFWDGVKKVLTNLQFWLVLIPASVSMGMTMTTSVLVIETILPYGYTDQQSGICASLIVVGGFFGGCITGYWIGRTGHHIMLLKIFVPVSIFTYISFIFDFIPNAYGAVIISCIMNGFFSYGLTPIYLELLGEITYPVSESISSCIVWSLGTFNLFIFSLIVDALRAGPDANPPNNMMNSLIAAVIIVAVGQIPVLWVKNNLKRLQVDSSNKETTTKA